MKWLKRGFVWSSFAFLMMNTTGCLLFTGTGSECVDDADCSSGYICSGGSCVVENNSPTPPTPTSCEGDLLVLWQFNGVSACPDDAEDVVIKIFDPQGNPLHQNSQGDAFSCTNGEHPYRSLTCGTYQVKVQAVDSTDAFTWSAPAKYVTIVDSASAEMTVDLQPE